MCVCLMAIEMQCEMGRCLGKKWEKNHIVIDEIEINREEGNAKYTKYKNNIYAHFSIYEKSNDDTIIHTRAAAPYI